MKTKEFIRRVEELGFKVTIFSYLNGKENYRVYQEGSCSGVAQVSENYSYSFDTNCPDFDKLSSEIRSKLFNLLVEYANTPIEKRKEEDKYYIKHVGVAKGLRYLNYSRINKEWYLSSKFSHGFIKNKFTLAELPDWAKEMLEQGHLVKEEVE